MFHDFDIISFMCRKIKNSISGSFYIHKHKPDFCELFIIYGGKLVFLRGENKKGIMENGEGVMIAKLREKNGFKGWLEKMFIENPSNSLERDTHRSHSSPTALDSPSSQNQCEIHMKEIENYYQHLLSLNLDDEEEEDCGQEENEDSQTNPMEAEHGEADLVRRKNEKISKIFDVTLWLIIHLIVSYLFDLLIL